MRVELRREVVAALAVFVAGLLVYVNTWSNDFAYDDLWIIVNNARVHQLADQAKIWLTPYWPTFGKELGLYRPLAIFLYALQWAAAGGKPWLFHVVNSALHAGVSVLVLVLLLRLTRGALIASLLGALLFAVHPVHSEAVANVVGQAELVAALGVLAAVLIHDARAETKATWPRSALVAALYGLAVLAKEGAMFAPLLFVATDVAQRRVRLRPREVAVYARAILPLIVTCTIFVAGYMALRAYVLGSITGTNVAPSYPFLYGAHRVLNGLRAWPEYARLLFFPFDLSADYSPGVILPVESFDLYVGIGALLLAMTVLGTALLDRSWALLGAAWLLITILPVSNLLYTIGVVLAERTLYLPSFGICVFAAYGWLILQERRPDRLRLAGAVAVIVLVAFSVRILVRNPDWKNTKIVMESILRDHPESYRAQWSEAVRAFGRGDTAKAEEHWLYAYRLWPRDPQMLTELGAFNMTMKRSAVAARILKDAHNLHPDTPRTEQFLAVASLDAGNFKDALDAVDRSIRLIGPTALLYEVRARSLMGLRRSAEAVHVWRQALAQQGGDTWIQWSLYGRALAEAGDRAAADSAFATAVRKAGGNPESLTQIERTRKFAESE